MSKISSSLLKFILIGTILGLASYALFVFIGIYPLRFFFNTFYHDFGRGDGLGALIFFGALHETHKLLWSVTSALFFSFILKNWRYFY